MGFTDRKPWTITEKDVAGKWGLGKDTRLKCYLCDKIAAVGDTFRWLYMNGHSPSPGNVMCCAGCDHVGIEDEIRAALVAWQKDFPGCNYEIRPAMKLAAPAQFRRITPETEITAPCLLTKDDDGFWSTRLCYIDEAVTEWKDEYTHWLPVQWPEVRG